MERKKIVIKSAGPIAPLGGVYGPILTPYSETLQTINTLITFKYDVHEVLPDGKHVKLTFRNLNLDNSVKEEPKAPSKPVTEPVKTEAAPVTAPEVKEEAVVAEPVKTEAPKPVAAPTGSNNRVEEKTKKK